MDRDRLNAVLEDIGLHKKDLARLVGQRADHVSQYGRRSPVPAHVLAIIEAWKMLTPDQRIAWLQGAPYNANDREAQ